MHYLATADTDIGIEKNVNQDSLLIKHVSYDCGEVLMAIMCDGMGGLTKGELASATVIREFSNWFDQEMPFELMDVDMHAIGGKWSMFLKNLNTRLIEYGQRNNCNLGTTFSGILFIGNEYVVVHVGDSRIYQINSAITQLTTDQTFVAREIRRGNMTPEQGKVDKRRNLLLQCIGASRIVHPEIIHGKSEQGVYLLCSDGFRNEITEKEMYESLTFDNLVSKQAMHSNVTYLIEQAKSRKERDNISAILVKVE